MVPVTNYSANRKRLAIRCILTTVQFLMRFVYLNRKAIPADAYAMSKMMLVSSYNQAKPEEQSPAIENKAVERDHVGR